jgi:hypothetical protein
MPVILATQKQRSAGSRFEASPGKYFMSPYLEIPLTKTGMAQGESPEFKPQY